MESHFIGVLNVLGVLVLFSVMLHNSFICDISRSNRQMVLIFYMQVDIQEMKNSCLIFLFCVVGHVQIWVKGIPGWSD